MGLTSIPISSIPMLMVILRAVCMLFMIELVLDVMIARQGTHCQGYGSVSLSSSRDLWEEADNATWWMKRKAYPTEKGEICGGRGFLRIQDLRDMLQRGAQPDMPEDGLTEGASFREVESWCETADEFGSLLWMAVMMEQSDN